jgi:hypothetical protein
MVDFVLKKELFDRTYELWLKITDQHQANYGCLRHHLPTAIQKLKPRNDDNNFNILSIGSSDGRMDLQILRGVIECLNQEDSKQETMISNAAIEPNPYSLQKYKGLIQDKFDSFQMSSTKVGTFELENKTFQEYVVSNHGENRFDMIHTVHTLNYLDDPKSALKHCYENELKDRGFIACI